jgi:chromosome partitioning protein
MTTIVAFVSQKGGVGKSTLARALACEAAKSGLQVKLADLDPMQRTVAEWHAVRLHAGLEPVGDVQILATMGQALAKVDAYDLIIIDGPARAETGTLEIARHANIVVQPSGASVDDLHPAVREFNGLVKAGVPKSRLVFALNHIATDTEEQDARDYIKEAGYQVLDGCLIERPAYRKAQNVGLSVTETPFKTLNIRADALIQSIIDKATQNG